MAIEARSAVVARYRLATPDNSRDATAPLFDAELRLDVVPDAPLTAAQIAAALPGGARAPGRGPSLAELPQPAVFCRAMDGWAFFATPDRRAWRALCMTFLNYDVSQRFTEATAWQSAELFDLVEKALGTYACDDLEGRCHLFGLPCVTLVDSVSPTEAAVRSGVLTGAAPR